MKNIIILIAIILFIGAGAWLYYLQTSAPTDVYENNNDDTELNNEEGDEENGEGEDEPTEEEPAAFYRQSTIGTSVNGNDISAHHFGNGENEVLFVGGIHGGYSYNTSLLAFELIDHLEANEDMVPESVTVTIIPVLNPDGLEVTTGSTDRFSSTDVAAAQSTKIAGRFNGNEVDINRNFDCKWQAEGTWQSRKVSAGSQPFSEPEAQAIRNYVNEAAPDAVVVWYSAAGGVYASSCDNGILTETSSLTNTYASASDYQAYESFDYYAITGDMVNWLAKEEIPAISVLLSDHENTEWNKNRAGVEAVINSLAN